MILQRVVAWVAGFVLLSALVQAADEPPATKPKTDKPAAKAPPARLPEFPFIDPETIKPGPLTPIPDDPPPHEGALIDQPYIIEPPDLIIVEVLEVLPGRPISGERLVRPDGKIDLGFYGQVHVRGLTLPQAKEKIILHLWKFLPDEVLGLIEVRPPEGEPKEEMGPKEPALPPLPPGVKPYDEPKKKPGPPAAARPGLPLHLAARPVRTAARRDDNPPTTVQVPVGGSVTIKVEVQGPPKPVEPERENEAEPGWVERRVGPVDSNRVFVDVTAYNSKFYYVQGDVAAPGKMPFTGGETVLDALNWAGGFIFTADRKNVRLYRPARAGKPLKVLPIDVDAIERGEAKLNYQLFPGDRLIVGRDALVVQTTQQDRLAGSFQTLVNSLMQLSFMTRTFNQAAPNVTPAQSEALMKEWFDLWWETANAPGGPKPDEAAFRELLLKTLRRPADAITPKK